MSSPVETQFTTLTEGFCAAINPTYEWLLICVSILVFTKVLWKRKNFAAELTWEGLLTTVNVVVPLEREFCGESLSTVLMLANEDSEIIIR